MKLTGNSTDNVPNPESPLPLQSPEFALSASFLFSQRSISSQRMGTHSSQRTDGGPASEALLKGRHRTEGPRRIPGGERWKGAPAPGSARGSHAGRPTQPQERPAGHGGSRPPPPRTRRTPPDPPSSPAAPPDGTAPNPRPRVSPPGTESAAVRAGPGSGQGAYITPLGSAGQGCEPHGGRPALTCCGCLGLPAAAAPSPPPSSRRAPRSCWLPAPLRRRWRRRRERRRSRQPITKALRPNGQATPPVRMRGESRPRPPRSLGTPPSVRRFAPRLGQRCGRRRSGRGTGGREQVGGRRLAAGKCPPPGAEREVGGGEP